MVRRQARAAGEIAPPTWQPVGPLQVNTAAWDLVTGRVTSVAADPADPSGNVLYAGAAGGGVWKSSNAAGDPAGVSFTPLTDTPGSGSSAALSSLSIGALSVQPNGSGVILAGTGDPNDASDSWYGGGILRSTDGGNTWSLIAGTAPVPSQYTYSFEGNAFAGFAWSTVKTNLVVAAVSQSEYGTILGLPGSPSVLGLYYSQDAGATWQLATLQDGSTTIESPQMKVLLGNAATAVVWNPVRQRFYAAIRLHGYYESADGMTWTRLQNQPGLNLTTAMCPAYAGRAGSPACPIFRGALAVQAATGDLFAWSVDENDIDQGLWQDSCALSSTGGCANSTVQFATRIAEADLDDESGNGTIAGGAYNLWLAAVPAQQDTLVFAGTTDIWRCSLANGCVWRNTTNTQSCGASRVAPFQLAVDASHGAEGLLYFGNEGGLWRSTDAVNQLAPACAADDANHFQNLNAGLGSLAEVEGFSDDPDDASILLAALGALGTASSKTSAADFSTVWNQVLDGEGDGAAIDPADPEDWYATSQFGVGINRCSEGTGCTSAGFGSPAIGEAQVDNDVQLIPAPWMLDPQNTADVILATCRIWRGPADGPGWSDGNLLSGMLDGNQGAFCNGNAEVRTLAVGSIAGSGANPSGAERIYAGMAGTLDGGALVPGHVFTATVDSGSQASTTKWADLYASPIANPGSSIVQFNPGGFDISSIYVDPHDASAGTVYVTIQGYSSSVSGQALVYRSTDAGAHWTDITANLPDAPANSIVVDPGDAGVVYVALDTGVYVTHDVSACGAVNAVCWNVWGSGLPNAPVTQIQTYTQGGAQLLRAATYGRGIWQVNLATSGQPLTTAVASPTSLTFSTQQVETSSSAQSIILTNSGSAPLTVTSIGMPADFQETDTCVGQPVAVHTSCQISVAFVPGQSGDLEETMTIAANVSGGQVTVALAGTALAAGSIVLTPSSLQFAPVPVGTTTAAQFVTVANLSTLPVPLGSETASGDFSVASNTCAGSLAAETSCTLGITLTPSTKGPRSGVLTVSDAAGIQTIQLSGTGQTSATDTLSAPSLLFAAQQVGTVSEAQQVTITNTGDQALTRIAVTVAGDFSAVNNCGTLLQGHGACTVSISYVPTLTGSESGTVTITDSLRTQSVSLTGTGIAPPGISATPLSVSFGTVGVSSTASPQLVTLTNSGGVTVTSLAAAITAGFSIVSNNCPPTFRAGEVCQVGITFSPAAAGAQTGTLSFTASGLTKPLSVALSGSGADFSIGAAGSASAVVESGQTANFSFQLAGLGGTSGTVALACAGAPQNATCSLNPATVAVSGSNTSTATIAIATGVSTTSEVRWRWNPGRTLPLLAIAAPVFWIGGRRRKAVWLAMMAAAILAVAGCSVSASAGSGGGGGSTGGGQNSTPAGSYTLTVTGTMANISHSATVRLTVQ